MTTALAGLENSLACLIAQAALEPIVNDYVERWRRCMERRAPVTTPNELIADAEAEGVPILTTGPLWSYLYQCADDYRLPDPERIIMSIVHGFAEDNFVFGTCPCPARKPLIEDPSERRRRKNAAQE